MERITKSEFKIKALEVLREVETTGRSVIVTDGGRPIIEIRRYQDEIPTSLDQLKGSVVELDDPTEPVKPDDWDAIKNPSYSQVHGRAERFNKTRR